MQVLKSSAPELFKLAASRAERSDVFNTATWHYQGAGRTIILVHGFRGDHHGLSAIAGALGDHHVVIPDLPGYGKTAPVDTISDHTVSGSRSLLQSLITRWCLGTVLGRLWSPSPGSLGCSSQPCF